MIVRFQSLEEDANLTKQQQAIKNVGKQDPKRHLGETVDKTLADNIVQSFSAALNTASFKWFEVSNKEFGLDGREC